MSQSLFANPNYPELITQNSNGEPGDGTYDNWDLPVSDDGRYVVFFGNPTNMDEHFPGNLGQQMYIRDRLTGTTKLASIDIDGQPYQGFDFRHLGISGNGRYAFFSGVADSVPPNPSPGVFRYDILNETSTIISLDAAGEFLRWVDFGRIGISYDGNTIAFGVSDFDDGSSEIYVRDIINNTVYTIDNGRTPLLSADASKLVYVSGEPNFAGERAFLYDVATATSTLIYEGDPGGDSVQISAFSRDGRYVFFGSSDPDVTSNTPVLCQQSGCGYRLDLTTGTIRLIVTTIDGLTTWPRYVSQWAVSGDGEKIVVSDEPREDGPCEYVCISSTGLIFYDFLTGQTHEVGYGLNDAVPSVPSGLGIGLTYDASEVVFRSAASNFGVGQNCVFNGGESIGYCGDLFVGSTAAVEHDDQQQTLSFSPEADAYVRSGQANHNQGGSQYMQVQSSGDNRGLVRFDQAALESAVGNGSVLSATLRLTITDNGNNWGVSGRTVDAHRLLADWAEGNGTESDRGTGSGATWNCASDSNIENQAKNCSGSTEWEMGQPNNPSVHPWLQTPTDTQTITNGLSGVVEYDVTADIEAFVDGSADNHGWIIKKTNEGQNGQVSFGTRESSLVPELVITYQP